MDDIPDVIYLQLYDDEGEPVHPDEVTVCVNRIRDTDIAYRRYAPMYIDSGGVLFCATCGTPIGMDNAAQSIENLVA